MDKPKVEKILNLDEYEALLGEAVEKSAAVPAVDTDVDPNWAQDLVMPPPRTPPRSTLLPSLLLLLLGLELIALLMWGLLRTAMVNPIEAAAARPGIEYRFGDDYQFLQAVQSFVAFVSATRTNSDPASAQFQAALRRLNEGLQTPEDGFAADYQGEDFLPDYFHQQVHQQVHQHSSALLYLEVD